MDKQELMQEIIKTYQKYLKWLKDYYMFNPHTDFESELASLNQQIRKLQLKFK